jgi:hypothetical protein
LTAELRESEFRHACTGHFTEFLFQKDTGNPLIPGALLVESLPGAALEEK